LACGAKLIVADWTLGGLAAFVALLFVALGALRLVTIRTFDGLAGAVSLLDAGGDLAVGAVLLAWPGISLFTMATVVGGWIAIRSVAAGTIIVTTRADRRAWVVALVVAVAELALGIVVMARADSGRTRTAVLVGAIAALEGALEISAGPRPHSSSAMSSSDR
jgi:uncharacterized membrane protein HdeD (DUF308 family)